MVNPDITALPTQEAVNRKRVKSMEDIRAPCPGGDGKAKNEQDGGDLGSFITIS